MRKTIKLATIFNIEIDINYSWFIIFGLVVFTLAQGYFPGTNPETSPASHWFMAIISAVLLFASLLMHELAHSMVAIHNNIPIHGITLFVFGGVAHMEKEPPSPRTEFMMAIAGPIMSFCLAFFFWYTTYLLSQLNAPSPFTAITHYLFIINLFVGIFNLIPGFPLDGGRILRAILWHYQKDLKKATGIASSLGKGFSLLLIAFGLYNLITGSIISGIWLIFIGFFLQETANTS